jgi:alcohol dehydrogenase
MHLPNFMEFECPVKTHYGDWALNHIPFELKALGAAKPLLIADEAASLEKRLKPVLEAFRDTDMTLGVVEDIPTSDMQNSLHQLSAIYRDKDCDAIIAVGQGSFIDLTKWLNLTLSTGEESLASFSEGRLIPRALKPLAVIPSAAADGFELSGYLRIQETTLASAHLMPQLLFLDPRTSGRPDDTTMVETALNALTNGVETFFCAAANPMKAVYARTATMLATEALCQLAGRGARDERLAITVAHAAALGGCALGCQGLSTIHHLAHAIASTGKATPTQAQSVLLSYMLERRSLETEMNVDLFLSLAGGNDRFARTPEHQRSAAAIYFLRNLINQLFAITDGKIGRTLQDIGLTREELPAIAEAAGRRDTECEASSLEAILVHAWEGRPVDGTT